MTDKKVKKLTPYQHIRKRSPMYYGSIVSHTQQVLEYDDNNIPQIVESTWVPAVFTCFREILDNALDEVLAHGYGNKIKVTYDPETMIMSVEDDGRGIPIEFDEEHNMHVATLALSEIMAGRNFEDRTNTAGVNGIGASGVNYSSTFFDIDIHRDGKYFHQSFKEGMGDKGEELDIQEPIIKTKKSDTTGTKITFKLSEKVFADLSLPLNFIRSRLVEIAAVNPEIKIYFNDKLIKVKPSIQKTFFDKKEVIDLAINDDKIDFFSRFMVVPNFTNGSDFSYSTVNNIPTFNGGSHMEAFKKYFVAGMLDVLTKEGKKRKLTPNRSDIMEGLLIFNVTNMMKADFDSQSKTRLINEEASSTIKKALDGNVDLFKKLIKKHSSWVDEIFERCAARTQKKDASELAKLQKKIGKVKVASLMDATGSDRSKCILTIAEGQSAIGGLGAVRDPNFHGGIPLRGKVLNVNGMNLKDVATNKILQDVMNALGLIIGKKADIKNLRYGQVWVATDADEDGYNIAALLINFFYTFWPELFDPKQEKAFIQIFQTPFIIAEKGKQRKYWYAKNYDEFKPEEWKGWTITRAKGLGTLTKEDWKYSITTPELEPIVDDGNLKESLDLLFNSGRSADRKDWMGI